MTNSNDYELGHDPSKQKELLLRAYNSADDDAIDSALARVVAVRRIKRIGTLEWSSPD